MKEIVIKNTKKKGGYVKLIVIILLAILLILSLDNRLRVRTYTIDAKTVTQPVKIALLTDLHGCRYGDKQDKLIAEIKKQNPDIILLGGDIYDDDNMKYNGTDELLEKITSNYPCYYVTGNHEFWSNDIENILKKINSYDITVLDGRYKCITVNGQTLNLCGVTDPDGLSTLTEYTNQLSDVSKAAKNGNYTILLAHRPEEIETYQNYDFDLVLSGHAHGGQWRIPKLLNGLYAPNQGFFPQYAGDRYDFKDMTLIVSRGLAYNSPRVPRLFNPPELVIIDIV